MPNFLSTERAIQKAFTCARAQSPLILNLTNFVAMNFSANFLLAAGASPIMAHAPEELTDLVPHVGGVLLNIGTLDAAWVVSMNYALSAAYEAGVPVVLDPVGVHSTPYRLATALSLLEQGGVTAIRGNAAEIMTLAGQVAQGRGVDSMEDTRKALPAAELLVKRYGLTVVVSGAIDWVVSHAGVNGLAHGHPMMAQVTAMGCAVSSLFAAFLSVEKDVPIAACATLAVAGLCGERAAAMSNGPGTFAVNILDCVYRLKPEDCAGLRWLSI